MADNQINEKSLRFIEGLGLQHRVHFARDPESLAIGQLGIANASTEPIEKGVPHPATYLIDRSGVVRFADVRTDFHIWLDPELIERELGAI